MIDILRQFILDEKLIQKNDKILLALSGGMDSMVLFGLLLKLKEELNFSLIAAHYDHKIRKSSKNDADFVKNHCLINKIRIFMCEGDVPEYAKTQKLSLETAARQMRHEFLNKTAYETNAIKIAIAHHKNDRAETYLMRVFRGTSGDGLGCMPSKDGMIIRPLMCAEHEDIKKYASANMLSWCEDETNTDISYTRNNIRHNTIPHIQKRYNSSIINTLSNNARLMKLDRDYFDILVSEKTQKAKATDDGYYLEDESFIYLHPAILTRCIKKVLSNLGFEKDIYEININQVIELFDKQKTGAMVNLPGGAIARRDAFGVELVRSIDAPEIFQETVFNNTGTTVIKNCGVFTTQETPVDIKKIKSHSKNVAFFDIIKLPDNIMVRTRRQGDIFHPLGAPGKKSLKEYFIDKKISRFKRDYIPLLTYKNEILWVVGYEISQKVKVTEDTIECKKIIFNIKRGENGR